MDGKVFKTDKLILAYVVGVALGDGNLSNPNGRAVRLRVSCDEKYPKLIKRIKQAISLLFPKNKVSIVRKPRHCIDISCYSNGWEKLLGWKAKGGPKSEQRVGIPHWVFSQKRYLKKCLKGLIETDGSIYLDRGYKMVMFTTVIPRLADDVYRACKMLDFEPRSYKIFKSKQTSKFGLAKSDLYRIRISKNAKEFLKQVNPQKN